MNILETLVYSHGEVNEAVAAIHSLEPYWIQRHAPLPYYTLGTASYMDAHGSSNNYSQLVKASNPILEGTFGWLYAKLIVHLQDVLGTPVAYDTDYALPGFHILKAHPWFTFPFATIHADAHFALLDWNKLPAPDFKNPISFTVALRVPSEGAGLDLWDIDYCQIRHSSPEDKRALFERSPFNKIPYVEGKLVVVKGLPMHRMSPFGNTQPCDERITLQGHGLWTGDHWLLYW
jgi:hypothetical protein